MGATMSRYVFKEDPYSSHSVILDWLAEGHGRRLLDVGCADGVLSRRFTERGWKVTTIEGDPVRAATAAAHCQQLILADLERELPPLGGTFDVIVYADVLEHLGDPLRVLRGLNAALAPDGLVVISVPNVAHLWVRLSLLLGRFDYADRGILDRGHLRFFTDRTLLGLVAAAGLTVERRTVTPAPLYQALSPRLHRPWLAWVHAVSAAAARRLPTLLGYQFLVIAKQTAGRRAGVTETRPPEIGHRSAGHADGPRESEPRASETALHPRPAGDPRPPRPRVPFP